jgi:heptosyltransferase-2
LARRLKEERYDIALVPHRSLRSAVIVVLGRIPMRVGFDTSSGSMLFSKLIRYRRDSHEVERNLSFLEVFDLGHLEKEYPALYPDSADVNAVDAFLAENGIRSENKTIAIAPGSVWKTKRWLPERFAEVARKLSLAGMRVVLMGGKEDAELCAEIAGNSDKKKVIVAAGRLTILQSAELLRRCAAIVTNDTAPMHLAVAMRTPVVAIFGATVPSFGFAPYGERDVVVQTEGLPCRPCSIHGGDYCPIGTFECMKNITAEMVYERAVQVQQKSHPRI